MIKFNRVNGWTYKTEDNQFIVFNSGPGEWYSAKIDHELVAEMDQETFAKYGYCSAVADESSRIMSRSLRDAMKWVREVEYKVGA